MEVSSKRLIDGAFADRCVGAWGRSYMTRSLSIVTSTSCCCPHSYAGWGHSDRALFWWPCSSGGIDWSQLSDITARTMWHLCEQVCKLIVFFFPLPCIQWRLHGENEERSKKSRVWSWWSAGCFVATFEEGPINLWRNSAPSDDFQHPLAAFPIANLDCSCLSALICTCA